MNFFFKKKITVKPKITNYYLTESNQSKQITEQFFQKVSSQNIFFRLINPNKKIMSFFFKNFNQKFFEKKTHNFFIAPGFIFSIFASLSTAALLYLLVGILHHKYDFFGMEKMACILFILSVLSWLINLEKQSQRFENYSLLARKNLALGIILFIISEVMIFFGVFWAYLHSSLAPSAEIGAIWPPAGLMVLEWWKWPALGTFLLIYSGFSANSFFYALRTFNTNQRFNCAYSDNFRENYDTVYVNFFCRYLKEENEQSNFFLSDEKSSLTSNWSTIFAALLHTLFFGFIFLLCQKHEYAHAAFSASDGIYGTVFFSITGLHGFHVFLGFALLAVIFMRLFFTKAGLSYPHTAAAGSVWYWHFVDIVWLFVFGLVYIWGSSFFDI